MRLVIDLQALQTESRYRGIGHYSFSLVKEILSIAINHEIIILLNDYENIDDIKEQLTKVNKNVHVKVFSTLTNLIEIIPDSLPRILISEDIRNNFIDNLNPDFLLISSVFEGAGSDFVLSIEKDKKYKIGIIGYDLIPLTDEEKYISDPNIKNWYYRKLDSVRKSDYIYAISESAGDEFHSLLNISKNKIINISSACDSVYHQLPKGSFCKNNLIKYGIEKDFILYSGALDDRKNLTSLLLAYSKLSLQEKNKYQILLVGKYSEQDKSKLDSFSMSLGIKDGTIKYTGFISTNELATIYNLCRAFVFPSLHEGFGLPVLEAISCGAPTICSNCSSLPQVINNDKATFDPLDINEFKDKLHLILEDDEFRNYCRKQGLKQSKNFSWKKTATILLEHIDKNVQPNVSSDCDYQKNYRKLVREISKHIIKYKIDDDVICEISKCISKNEIELSNEIPKQKFSWRIEGPFDSSYSLALVNREIARALKSIGQDVNLHSTEGGGDYSPNMEYLSHYPDIVEMYSDSFTDRQYDIVTRNLYPPRVEGMTGSRCNLLLNYAWEESGFPTEWVNNFNDNLTGITCVSEHVRKIMIDNGVSIPLKVCGNGVDHWERISSDVIYPLNIDKKRFKFLHVSSCFPRKGVDILLKAYAKCFTSEDNVTLVIKTFNNPHNDVSEQIALMKKNYVNFPDVFLIEDDLKDYELKSLYKQCDTLVAPSRAEGFGLPIAEAILSGIPVITTAWGGQLEFCNPTNSWLIDYKFKLATTHFELYNSVWVEPDIEDLVYKLKEVYEADSVIINEKVTKAKNDLLARFTWEKVAINSVKKIEEIKNKKNESNINIAWVSTWNQRCGISSYSEYLVGSRPNVSILAPKCTSINKSDNCNVHRCWSFDGNDSLDELYKKILDLNINVVVIQMNYYFFDYSSLANLIIKLKKNGVIVTITLHSTKTPEESKDLRHLLEPFKYVDRIMVHTVNDLNRLKNIGLVNNVQLFNHGVIDIEPNKNIGSDLDDFICISSYGFALPHKGIEELIEAYFKITKIKKNTKLVLINAEHQDPVSKTFIDKIKNKISDLGIEDKVFMNTNYLSDEDSLGYLQKSDVIVMAYQNTGESSSAAVRTAISSGAPVLVTPLSIFNDVHGAVHYLDGCDVNAIKNGIIDLLENKSDFDFESVNKWRNEHSYKLISKKFFNILNSLHINS